MKIQSVKALTMVELLVVLVISSVLILMVGVLSNIAFSSHEDLRKEVQVYNDLFYGFDFLVHTLRNAPSTSTISVNYSANNALTINNLTFKKDNTDFKCTDSNVYPNADNFIIKEVGNLNFDFRCSRDVSGNWIQNSCSPTSRIFHITLSGEKDKESFNLSTDVMRRN